MHLNGHSIQQQYPEHPDESYEMVEAESRAVAGRVTDLERRVLEQGDELVCLKATLAETLRRVTMLEGMRLAQQQPTSHSYTNNNIPHSHRNNNTYSNNKDQQTTMLRSSYRTVAAQESRWHHHVAVADVPAVGGRRGYHIGGSALPQRRAVHYQSTGSLHSDSHSSSSVSPVPSPAPHQPGANRSAIGSAVGHGLPRRPPSAGSAASATSYMSSVGGGGGGGAPLARTVGGSPSSDLSASSLHKRWSSTGDFNQANSAAGSPNSPCSNKTLTKSFMNLCKASSTHFSNLRHGSKDASYHDDDHTVKLYLRGRPIILPLPTAYLTDTYDLTKVQTAPAHRLKLDWAYGYRGRDCRSNLHHLPTGEMVYFVAAVVILYNAEEQQQRHYVGHTDDVKSLAVHPNKLLVATGQCAGHGGGGAEGRAHVRVWDSVNLSTVAVLGLGGAAPGEFVGSVCCLSFSKADGGSLLLAVDEAPDHVISVWDWQRHQGEARETNGGGGGGGGGFKITETKCSVDTIVAAEFHPLDRNSIVTCGKSHIAFWTLDVSGTLFKRMGIFESREKPKYVLSVAFLQTGDVITGDSNGNMAVWARGTNTISKFIKGVHEGGVFTVLVMKSGNVISGGGKDGCLVHFDASLNRIGGDNAQIEGHFGGVRVVSEGKGAQLLVGTTRNCILTGNATLGYQPIVLGHTDELWALAAHPTIPQFATAGHDKLLQMWDSMSHSILWSKDIGERAQSVAFGADGAQVVVGCVTGKWLVFDTQTRELLAQYTDGAEAIQCVHFSPDGHLLALGSRDNNVYVYQVPEHGGGGSHRYCRVGKCVGHSSFITHLDWSADGTIIRSNSGDYELLYWNATTCRQIAQSHAQQRDIEWSTNTCTISPATIGIWPESADGTDVNACNRSHDIDTVHALLATGDDFGKVRLYAYPASQPKTLSHAYGGHSSHVTNVTFLHDDTRLVSIGGKDTSVLQWVVL